MRAKLLLQNPLLHRYWFRVSESFSFGMTAYSREDAQALLAENGLPYWRGHAIEEVLEDIDVQSVVEVCIRRGGFGPPIFRGVWHPFLNLQAPCK